MRYVSTRVFTASWLTETFADGRINADWDEDGRQIADLDLPEMTGGANPGDCRALYYLVRRLKPQRILEIGTHLGCSTVTQAMAVARNRADGIAATLDTVDIRDVNDPQMRPGWSSSPLTRLARTIATLGCEEFVRFKVGRSLDVLADSHRRYGMIFLDGDHSAEVVYQEIPLALRRLEPPGLIMLHDYFPDQRPLWPGREPVVGPNLGVGRIVSEGAGRAVPLGDLPWPTKLGTQTTSLAVLTRAECPPLQIRPGASDRSSHRLRHDASGHLLHRIEKRRVCETESASLQAD